MKDFISIEDREDGYYSEFGVRGKANIANNDDFAVINEVGDVVTVRSGVLTILTAFSNAFSSAFR